ncbi:MAG: hypothetical protein IT389_02985 [Nitrospira sp.]|nr:hypothetical protein [Nitrospira sp.]
MTVLDNIDALVRSRSNIQRDVRRIHRQRFQPVVSLGDEGVESFYQEFYLSLSKVRYQELLVVRTADDLRRRAQQRGCRVVDFRGSRPTLSDGLLRYKSKWGVCLYEKTDSYHDLFIRWNRASDVVEEFLSMTPLIFRDEGGLSALVGDEPSHPQMLWVDGLRRWYRLTDAGLLAMPLLQTGQAAFAGETLRDGA